ncbi:hypothetical protein J3F84DRAFT_372120 [Trichoderma pleuroticola]
MPCLGIIRSSGLAFLSLGTSSARLVCPVCMYMLILRILRPCPFFLQLPSNRPHGILDSTSPPSPHTCTQTWSFTEDRSCFCAHCSILAHSTERKKWSANCIDMSVQDYNYI